MAEERTRNAAPQQVTLLNIEREKPHNDDAEIAVLGAMMISPTAASTAISTLRFGEAFYRPAHQIIFNAMLEMDASKGENAMDMVVLCDHLKRNGQLEAVGGISYVAMLPDRVPTANNVEFYADIVKQNAILRRMIDACTDGIVKSYEASEDPKSVLDTIERNIFDITQLNEVKDYQKIPDLITDALAYFQKLTNGDNSVSGLKTGFEYLDRLIIGLKPGDMFVLAARPSVGKTAMALNIAANIALRGDLVDGKPPTVGIFSLEMSAQQLVLRLIASEARVNTSKWRYAKPTQNEVLDFQDACHRLKQSNIIIDDTGGIDILELRAKARRMKSRDNVSCIFIDYLQLIHVDSSRNSTRENEVSKISGSLKALAKELQIPIVVLAQLNRATEQNKNEQPKLSNLRESGAIEQDADVVALLHRDITKQREMTDDDMSGTEAELIVAKNRSGRTGVQKMLFFPQFTLYTAASQISDEDVPPDAK